MFLSLSNSWHCFKLSVTLHYPLYLESHLSQGFTISGDTAFSQIYSAEIPFYMVLPNLRGMSFSCGMHLMTGKLCCWSCLNWVWSLKKYVYEYSPLHFVVCGVNWIKTEKSKHTNMHREYLLDFITEEKIVNFFGRILVSQKRVLSSMAF